MKWKKYTIETTTAAEDFMSSMLMDLGIEGIEIEDNIPLTKEDQADMFIDFLPELPPSLHLPKQKILTGSITGKNILLLLPLMIY